ncbi:formate/nitrite transporter family protein [Catenovulum sp. 2E275]|uniref:formate/nitrite transporter family protein n=1 Tax=Catenovulum sp. 2E275 TaxID=2980497 RepID=UPI0021D30D70|nr:formate/nitrite transporter family protein [Catenovulum sp. 2E275]MCU4674302.1 formate/nitrite transporter family protein [Catenovulum sp. 2E275]
MNKIPENKSEQPDSDKKIISTDGEILSAGPQVERTKERAQESKSYTSVIVKRTDETFRHPDDILQKAIEEGELQHARPYLSLLLSSVAAGMIICFTVMLVGIMASLTGDLSGFNKIFVALVYPLGFILVILSRSQLFTEHTATAFYPVLDGKNSYLSMFRLWGVVILGNLLGGVLSASMLAMAEPVIHAKDGYAIIAEHIVQFPFATLIISAILAGWLMALGAWLTLSTHSTSSQILCIYIVTFAIGLGGLHHSIAGTVELIVAYLTTEQFELLGIIRTIGIMLIGNAIGGSIFVALLNYSHIRKLQRTD